MRIFLALCPVAVEGAVPSLLSSRVAVWVGRGANLVCRGGIWMTAVSLGRATSFRRMPPLASRVLVRRRGSA